MPSWCMPSCSACSAALFDASARHAGICAGHAYGIAPRRNHGRDVTPGTLIASAVLAGMP